MSKTKNQPKAPSTRTVHLPKEVHKKILIAAAHREQDVQVVAAQAVLAGLPLLDLTPQPSAN